MKRRELRRHIFEMLFRIEFHSQEELKDQLTLFLQGLREEKEVSSEDELYIREKYKNIMETLPALDEAVSRASAGWKPSRIGKVELTILRLAVYEMQYDEDVPVGVAINEAVELAKEYGQEDSASFINGILGKAARGTEDGTEDSVEDLSGTGEAGKAKAQTRTEETVRIVEGPGNTGKKKVFLTRHPERSSVKSRNERE